MTLPPLAPTTPVARIAAPTINFTSSGSATWSALFAGAIDSGAMPSALFAKQRTTQPFTGPQQNNLPDGKPRAAWTGCVDLARNDDSRGAAPESPPRSCAMPDPGGQHVILRRGRRHVLRRRRHGRIVPTGVDGMPARTRALGRDGCAAPPRGRGTSSWGEGGAPPPPPTEAPRPSARGEASERSPSRGVTEGRRSAARGARSPTHRPSRCSGRVRRGRGD